MTQYKRVTFWSKNIWFYYACFQVLILYQLFPCPYFRSAVSRPWFKISCFQVMISLWLPPIQDLNSGYQQPISTKFCIRNFAGKNKDYIRNCRKKWPCCKIVLKKVMTTNPICRSPYPNNIGHSLMKFVSRVSTKHITQTHKKGNWFNKLEVSIQIINTENMHRNYWINTKKLPDITILNVHFTYAVTFLHRFISWELISQCFSAFLQASKAMYRLYLVQRFTLQFYI